MCVGGEREKKERECVWERTKESMRESVCKSLWKTVWKRVRVRVRVSKRELRIEKGWREQESIEKGWESERWGGFSSIYHRSKQQVMAPRWFSSLLMKQGYNKRWTDRCLVSFLLILKWSPFWKRFFLTIGYYYWNHFPASEFSFIICKFFLNKMPTNNKILLLAVKH